MVSAIEQQPSSIRKKSCLRLQTINPFSSVSKRAVTNIDQGQRLAVKVIGCIISGYLKQRELARITNTKLVMGRDMTATTFKARFATTGRLTPIEDWLTENMEGTWSIKMDSVSEDMSIKNYILIFDNESDRDSFKLRFTLGKAAYEKKPEKTKRGVFGKIAGLFGKSAAKTD